MRGFSPLGNDALATPYVPRLALLTCLFGAAVVAAISIGAYPLDLALLANPRSDSSALYVLWELRLPRVLLAAFVGASLALSGLSLQTLFRNPLADPGLIGVASGAALGAVLCLLLQPILVGYCPEILRPFMVPIAAFGGGLGVTAGMFAFVRSDVVQATAQLLLLGVAVNAFAFALIGWVLYAADDQTLRDFTFWNLGSLAGATWELALPIVITTGCGLWLLLNQLRCLDALALGERAAEHLGIDSRRTRRHIVLASALMVGAAVAAAGLIGFVGLVVPHLARAVCGATHRRSLPAAALLGAGLLVCADLISRTVVLPAELPIGIVTALAGTPFLVWLIHRDRGLGGVA